MEKEKRIIFTGGGTAGHVIVNLALIPYFHQQGWKIDYIGSKDGIEKELISGLPYVTYHAISTGKLRRYISVENIKDPFKVLKGTFDAWKIIGKVKPQVIFSKGGFVSVPVVVAARMRRIPTIIHESDITPGLANKLASKFAKKIITTFPETAHMLPEKKAIHVGAVVRDELFTGNRERAYTWTKLTPSKPVILIMGGSSGSQKMNEMVRENLHTLLEQYQIIHICGAGNIDEEWKMKGYRQYEYIQEELKDIFAISDYVISRAGANAIFEFLALQIPMLLIPLPLSVSRGDQIENAKSFVESGYAKMINEEDITQASLKTAIDDLVRHAPEIKAQMHHYSSKAARDEVIGLIEKMAKNK